MSYVRRVLVVALLLGLSQSAWAVPSWMQEGKTGPFMFNLHIGPAIGAKDAINMGAIVLDFGFAVDHKKNAYLLFPMQFQFANVSYSVFGVSGGYTVGYIMVPLGFQYDIAIPQVPGLYISPRIVGGYTAITASCTNCDTKHAGFIAPEATIKLVINKRWNVGLVPFSLPIFISSTTTQTPTGTQTNIGTSIDYRILFFGGLNF
jgi:hypothetical protein